MQQDFRRIGNLGPQIPHTPRPLWHLLAALVSLGVDNVIVELNSPEVPIMDGSAAPFIYLIQEAGVKKLAAHRKYLKIVRPIAQAVHQAGTLTGRGRRSPRRLRCCACDKQRRHRSL